MSQIRGEQISGSVASASYAVSASYADYAYSASYTFTASYIEYAQTASYAPAYTLSASFDQFTGSYANDSSSFESRTTSLELFSSSLDSTYATDAELSAATASLSSSLGLLSSSYLEASASFSASIASLIDATSSYVQNSQTSSMTVLSSSFASTASYAPAYLPLTGGTINGDVIVNGTASVTFLNVTYESASIIYSSGSNQLGDDITNTQTLIGSVNITGSLNLTGSAVAIKTDNFTVTTITDVLFADNSGIYFYDANGSSSVDVSSRWLNNSLGVAVVDWEAGIFTGSLQGTSSWAENALTASNILGGKAPHVPYFITDTTLATSSLYQSGSGTVIINQDNATSANPEALYVWQPSTSSFNVISGKGDLDNYLQLNIQNTNQGTNASSDVVATANNGGETDNYIDMGINSENFAGFLGGPNDSYLYTHGHNFWIGNINDGYKTYFFNSSSLTPIITLNASSADVTGSLYGTASWAENAVNADNATTSSYAITASYALNVPVTASYAVSTSYAVSASQAIDADNASTAISASHALVADNALTANYAATAGNGGVTQITAGSGITLLPPTGLGNVTVIASGGGGVTIISGSLVTGSFINTNTYTFNHNLNTRTPIITVFDSNYNQIIPQNIQLIDSSSALITFPTLESGFAIGSTGGTTGTALSSSYALFATYAETASYFVETDPIFVAKSASLATTGSNVFIGNQIVTGSLYTTGSNTLVGNTVLTGSLNITGSTTFTGAHTLSGSNTIIGNTVLSGSVEVSGSTVLHNSVFIVTGSTFVKGDTHVSGSTTITGSFNVLNGDINVISGSSFTRWGNKLFNYGQFSDTTTQSGSANTAYAMKFNTTDFALGASLVSGSRIQVENTGVYNLQFSAQLTNTANSNITFDIWFAYTGSNVANSNTQVDVNKSAGQIGRTVAAWNFSSPIQANDYVEIMWSCTSATGQLIALPTASAPTRPAVPSVIATLTQIA